MGGLPIAVSLQDCSGFGFVNFHQVFFVRRFRVAGAAGCSPDERLAAANIVLTMASTRCIAVPSGRWGMTVLGLTTDIVHLYELAASENGKYSAPLSGFFFLALIGFGIGVPCFFDLTTAA